MARLVRVLTVLVLGVVAFFVLTMLINGLGSNIGSVEVGIFGVLVLLVAIVAALWPEAQQRD